MTSKTASSDTTLDQFELAGKPTSIGEVEETASQDVVDAFGEVSRFKTGVKINGRNRQFLIGRSTGQTPTAYRLYHQPESEEASGFAGTLIHHREFKRDGDDEHTVVFNPAGESPAEETEVFPVAELVVKEHDRTERLDNVLDKIRTALTNSNWTDNGRADTGYGEWIQAVNELADFIDDLEDQPEQFPARAVMEAKIMHGIARYPLGAEDLLAQVSDCLRDNMENGLYDASPEAFRTLLLRYADSEAL
jgi:hypothetical protein